MAQSASQWEFILTGAAHTHVYTHTHGSSIKLGVSGFGGLPRPVDESIVYGITSILDPILQDQICILESFFVVFAQSLRTGLGEGTVRQKAGQPVKRLIK